MIDKLLLVFLDAIHAYSIPFPNQFSPRFLILKSSRDHFMSNGDLDTNQSFKQENFEKYFLVCNSFCIFFWKAWSTNHLMVWFGYESIDLYMHIPMDQICKRISLTSMCRSHSAHVHYYWIRFQNQNWGFNSISRINRWMSWVKGNLQVKNGFRSIKKQEQQKGRFKWALEHQKIKTKTLTCFRNTLDDENIRSFAFCNLHMNISWLIIPELETY